LALGISLTSTGVAGVVLPPFLTPLIAVHGWRSGYVVLGVIVLVTLPLVWFWIRDRPGVSPADAHLPPAGIAGVASSEAFADRTFWTLGAMFFLVSLAVGGLIISFIPLLLDAGLSAAQAGGFGALIGASVMAGRLITGYLVDRLFAPMVTAVIFALVGAGCLAFVLVGIELAFVAALALGFAMGAEVDLLGYFTAKYFGLANYGMIYGALYSCFSVGAGVSPVLAGYIYDVSGGYDWALLGASGLLAGAVLLSLSLKRFPVLTVTPVATRS